MSVPAADRRRAAPSTSLGRSVARYPVTSFLLMAYAISWTVFAPVVLSELGLISLPFEPSLRAVTAVASVLGLALPAFAVTVAVGGRAGALDLLRRCLRWRVGARWYLVALFGLLAATILGAGLLQGAAPFEVLARKWPLLFSMFLPEVLIPLVLIQIWEEAGWTGFMQSTLQDRHGPLVASLAVAPAFALVHLPLLTLGVPLARFDLILLQLGLVTVLAAFFRVVIMWLYNGTGGSVLVVALFHGAFNSATGSGDAKFTSEIFSGSATAIPLALTATLALLLVVVTRGRLSFSPVSHARR